MRMASSSSLARMMTMTGPNTWLGLAGRSTATATHLFLCNQHVRGDVHQQRRLQEGLRGEPRVGLAACKRCAGRDASACVGPASSRAPLATASSMSFCIPAICIRERRRWCGTGAPAAGPWSLRRSPRRPPAAGPASARPPCRAWLTPACRRCRPAPQRAPDQCSSGRSSGRCRAAPARPPARPVMLDRRRHSRAWSKSQSSHTTAASLPPSSSTTGVSVVAASRITNLPTYRTVTQLTCTTRRHLRRPNEGQLVDARRGQCRAGFAEARDDLHLMPVKRSWLWSAAHQFGRVAQAAQRLLDDICVKLGRPARG